MKIKFENINKEFLEEKLKDIQYLLNYDFEDLDFNEENIKKTEKIVSKYNNLILSDWKVRTAKIIVTNSNDERIATIK